MFNKRELLIKLGLMVMSFAVVTPSACLWLVGEPKLPKKLQK